VSLIETPAAKAAPITRRGYLGLAFLGGRIPPGPQLCWSKLVQLLPLGLGRYVFLIPSPSVGIAHLT
jgi:hypothetical protein